MMDFGFSSEFVDLTPFLNKLEKNELTLEDILEEDSIIDDIKNNYQSPFINFLTNEKIKKLIDYSTKLPSSDTHNIGYKYPFNATEILCSENINFQKQFMKETPLGLKDINDIELKEKLEQAKNIRKGGFLSELFKIINKVKKELKKEGKNKNISEENESDSDSDIDIDDDYEEIEEANLKNDENKENKNIKVIYENVDYLLNFLKESEETKENYVLVGYFYKILNNLIKIHSMKIVQYLFDYPKKDEFDILGLFIKHMNRKSMCDIIYRLLTFEDEFISQYDNKKLNLLEKIFDEINICNDKNKLECICDSLSLVMNNSHFFNIFMTKSNLLEKIYVILFNTIKNSEKSTSILKLLIKINMNIIQHFEVNCTNNMQDINNELNPFNVEICVSHEQDKSISSHEDNDALKKYLFLLFGILEKNKLIFLDDFGDCNQKENSTFMATYMEKQKKIGMKKIVQIEYILSILDIFVNSCASKYHEDKIAKLINFANERNLFFNLHNLFFAFPFSNIYQIYYKRIMEIVLNENSPKCLINSFFINPIEKEKNLIDLYIDTIISPNMKFNFGLTNTKSFNPCFSYAFYIIDKIYKSKNSNVKKILEKNKNLSVFYEILGEEIINLFNQKLLYNNTFDISGEKEEQSLQTFGPNNLIEVFEENCKIYDVYKNGGNYQQLLKGKKERIENEKKEQKEKVIENNIKIGSNNGIEYYDDFDDEDDDPLFKVEKINVQKEKKIANNQTEKLNKDKNNTDKNNNKFNNDNNNSNGAICQPNNAINDSENNQDKKENNRINIEKDSKENEKLNEDLIPNHIENKIYHVDYNKNNL